MKYTVHEGNVRTFENEILGKESSEIPEYLLIGLHTCGKFSNLNTQERKTDCFSFRKFGNYEHGYFLKFSSKGLGIHWMLLSYIDRFVQKETHPKSFHLNVIFFFKKLR